MTGQTFLSLTAILKTLSLLLCGVVVKFFYDGYKTRMMYRRLRDQGFPMMQHSLFWGHLRVLGEYAASFPKDNTTNDLAVWMSQEWKTLFPEQKECPSAVYLDVWPIAGPMIYTLHPKMSAQFTQTRSLPKDEQEKAFLRPMTQNKDLVTNEGEIWKKWRSTFNPGFSPRNITALVPAMMAHMMTFLKVMDEYAAKDGQKGRVVQLEKLTTNLTFDIITEATLGLQLNEQIGQGSVLKRAMTDMTKRIGVRFNIARKIATRNPWSQLNRNNHVMRNFLMPHIKERLSSSESAGEVQTIMGLAATSLRKDASFNTLKNNPEFLDTILQNLKVFLFAGHDTTATTICWAFKMLEENPTALVTIRREHDQLLGPDPKESPERILSNPHLLNSMPYTVACIKETLRLYSPAGTMRTGQPGFFLVCPTTGRQFPTEGFGIGDGAQACHHREDVWPSASRFIPERWLVKEGDLLFPPKDAWRPFELGPRNCIGQELAMMELKLVLALVVRSFDIRQAWDEWDALNGHTGKKDMVRGERLYMTGDGTGHTKDETPVLITRRISGSLE